MGEGKDLLSLQQGEYLVKLARQAAVAYITKGARIEPENTKGIFGQARGVFVTVETYPSHKLRGCIGYPLPSSPLAQAVCENAINATCEDPRFPQVSARELESLVFEISVLTVPKKIEYTRYEELPKLVKVGRDGLIVRSGWYSGLLLPQVPCEYGWTSEEFLSHTCEKAGLGPDEWKQGRMEIMAFTAQIFCEQSPNGKIIQVGLSEKRK